MQITDRVAMELASHEGLVRQAYKDSVGVWTWSIGITSASDHAVERYIDAPQTLEHCMAIYVWALEKYAADVRRVFSGHSLTEAQFAAAVSFHYNTGAIARASWVKKWKAGDVAGAKKSFMSWKKPAEIIPRRMKERDLFFDGKWSSDGKVTEYTALTSRNTPNWSSARRVDIRNAMPGATQAPASAPKPQPNPIPAPTPTSPSQGFWARLWAALTGGK